jgi:hypothetical protein
MADNSKSRFGRRRPYIAVGVALCSTAFILFGFTRNFASIITTWGSPAVSITLLFDTRFGTLTMVSEQRSDHLARSFVYILHRL